MGLSYTSGAWVRVILYLAGQKDSAQWMCIYHLPSGGGGESRWGACHLATFSWGCNETPEAVYGQDAYVHRTVWVQRGVTLKSSRCCTETV